MQTPHTKEWSEISLRVLVLVIGKGMEEILQHMQFKYTRRDAKETVVC